MKILKAFTDKFPLKTTSKKAWLQLWIFSDLCQDFLPKIKNFWSLRLILKRLRLQTLIKMTILATKILCSINFWQSEVKKHWEGTFQKVLNISERKIQRIVKTGIEREDLILLDSKNPNRIHITDIIKYAIKWRDLSDKLNSGKGSSGIGIKETQIINNV